jgi:predicted RNA-binding protein YlxR (DUF448 family)
MESRAPLRTCIGCRRKEEQGLLLRVSRNQSGELTLSEGNNRSGRGAYICPQPECIAAALKGDRLARAVRSPITAQEKSTIHEELKCKLR